MVKKKELFALGEAEMCDMSGGSDSEFMLGLPSKPLRRMKNADLLIEDKGRSRPQMLSGHKVTKATKVKKVIFWSEDQEKVLKQMVVAHCERGSIGTIDCWRAVAKEVGGDRTVKQCREKWRNDRPGFTKGQWSVAEEAQLVLGFIKWGAKWSLISRDYLPKRSGNTVKNRYKSVQRALDTARPNSDVSFLGHYMTLVKQRGWSQVTYVKAQAMYYGSAEAGPPSRAAAGAVVGSGSPRPQAAQPGPAAQPGGKRRGRDDSDAEGPKTRPRRQQAVPDSPTKAPGKWASNELHS
jgi:hypothetical protein